MSRLYDRVMAHGCDPLSARDVMERAQPAMDALRRGVTTRLTDRLGREPTVEEVAEDVIGILSALGTRRSPETLELDLLEDAVVIAADEVGRYFVSLPAGTRVTDVVSVVAPPFERFFVEFEDVPGNEIGLPSWGVLFEQQETQYDEEGWLLRASLVGEWRKGKAVGPIATWILPLDKTGVLFEGDADGYGSIFGSLPEIEGVPDEAAFDYVNGLTELLGAALLAVSYFHCRNVDKRIADPPERLSRKHERKTGRPLTRYYVLDIEPMRRILDSEGNAQTEGLKHALHICRGHFKTYEEDAPLFGKLTGTYWWESQVRGKAEDGVVEKDYRIRLDQGLGREYVEADEHLEIEPSAAEHAGLDPDLGGRGLRAHNVTQNLLAQAARDAGHEPRRPKPDEPQFDLAWEVGDVTWVAEVKSITPRNEEKQLRAALGQVLRYRQLLGDEGRTVKAMIATEVKPSDPTWSELCVREDITLVWGPADLTVD